MMRTKRNIFFLPYATDMASTFSMYHQDCTTHTTQPVAQVAYEIVFQSVLYMKNLAYSPWSSRHWVETETISNSIGFMIIMMLNSNNIWILCALHMTQGS